MCMICKFAYQCHIGLLKSYRYFMTYRDMIPLHLTSGLTLENNLEPKRIKAKARQKRLLNLTMSLNLHLVMKTCQKTHQRFNQEQKSESGLQLGSLRYT